MRILFREIESSHRAKLSEDAFCVQSVGQTGRGLKVVVGSSDNRCCRFNHNHSRLRVRYHLLSTSPLLRLDLVVSVYTSSLALDGANAGTRLAAAIIDTLLGIPGADITPLGRWVTVAADVPQRSLGGARPSLGGARPSLGGARPSLGGARPPLGGARPPCITKREGKATSTEPPAGWRNTDHIGIIVLFGAGFSRPGLLAGPKTHDGRSTNPQAPNPKAKALRRLAA